MKESCCMNKLALIDYNDIYFESKTLRMELESMSDDSLMDECNYILNGVKETTHLDNLFVNFFKKGSLTEEERKEAESLYLLAYLSMGYDL